MAPYMKCDGCVSPVDCVADGMPGCRRPRSHEGDRPRCCCTTESKDAGLIRQKKQTQQARVAAVGHGATSLPLTRGSAHIGEVRLRSGPESKEYAEAA